MNGEKENMEKAEKSAKGFFGEFRKFITRGNVMDMAVGVIIGGAFGTIVKSLTDDILMPIISLATGGLNFSSWFISLNGQHYATLAEAQAAGASTLNFGNFISSILYFIILAFCIFLIVRTLNRIEDRIEPKKEAAPTTKKCPFCKSDIPIDATRCPHCTSELPAEKKAKD